MVQAQILLRFLSILLFVITQCLAEKPGDFAVRFDRYNKKIIADVQVKGLKYTREHIVLRELKSLPGTAFETATLEADIRSLEKLDIFAKINADVVEAGASVNIVIELIEIPLIIIHPTGEITEENGISLGVGSISTNLWGLNHFLEASFKTGFQPGGVQRVSFEYMLPRIKELRITPALWIADERRSNKIIDTSPVKEEYQIARLRLKTIHIYRKHFQVGTQIEGVLERFAFARESVLNTPGYDGVTISGLTLFYDSRNVLGNPTRGLFLETGLFNHGGFTGGDIHFISTIFDTRIYRSLTDRQHLLFTHLSTLQKKTGRGGVPIYKNFWIGGANSVRGYKFGHQHGVNQFLLSAEYRYLLMKPRVIPLVLFNWKVDLGLQPFVGLDYGTTWNHKFGEQEFLLGNAYGLQILIPYKQMVRLELGLSNFNNISSLNFTLHLAAESKPVVARYRRR